MQLSYLVWHRLCTYNTDEEIAKESVARDKIELLKLHTSTAHPQLVSDSARSADNLAKRDRIKCPTVKTDSKE